MAFYAAQEMVSAWIMGNKPSSTTPGHNPPKSGSLEQKHSKKEAEISLPCAFDVLLGRGKSNQKRPGNARYKALIEMYRDSYCNAITRKSKRAITMVIFEAVFEKGRFLKQNITGGGPKRATISASWIELPVEEAFLKIAHALQYRRRCSLQQLQQQHADCGKEEKDEDRGKEDEYTLSTTTTTPSYSGGTIIGQIITHTKQQQQQQQQQQTCRPSSEEQHQHHLDPSNEASSKPERKVTSVMNISLDDTPDNHHDDLESIGIDSLASIHSFIFDQEPGAIDAERGLSDALSVYRQQQQAFEDANQKISPVPLYIIAVQEPSSSCCGDIMEFIDAADGTNYFENCWDDDKNDEW